jgi:hypothetical protein
LKLFIFDGLLLGANAISPDSKVHVIVTTSAGSKKSMAWTVAFARRVEDKTNAFEANTGTSAKEVVDVWSIRQSPMSGTLWGDHPNYYDTDSLIVFPRFSEASSTAEIGTQTSGTGKYKQSKTDGKWTLDVAGLATSYWICDAFGDKIAFEGSSASGQVSSTASAVLQDHSTLIVYTQDGSHYHRYIVHVG